MKKIITATLLIFFLVGGVSEAVNLKKGIIGKWFRFYIIAEEQLEFLKDGKVILVRGYKSHVGDYGFIDDNRLLVNIDFEEKIYEVSIDKQGQLILTDPVGNVNRYFTKTEYEKRRAAEKAEQAKLEAEKREKIKERFTFSDLTVLDNETKLMWARDANIASKEMTWDDAFKFVESLNQQKYAGYSDWRLPSREELETLVNVVFKEKEKGNTLYNLNRILNESGFKNVEDSWYWSSTTVASNSSHAWNVNFGNGYVSYGYSKSYDYYVWCVRGGQ